MRISGMQIPLRAVALATVLLMVTGVSAHAVISPYATTLVSYGGTFGPNPYNDPYALLGMPATDFYDPWGGWSGGTKERKVKLVEPAYNRAPDQTTKLITTFNANAYAVVGFDHPVEDDPLNPYGLDFLVFGNSFYTGSDFINDSTNMGEYRLTGGGFFENVLISVSPGYEALAGQVVSDWTTWRWYDYTGGPYGDNAFPTHAYEWDQSKYDSTGNGWTDNLMDFTKPVNPAYYDTLMAGGMTGAAAIAMYEGSGGGTGFDLAPSGFSSISYIKVWAGDGSDFLGGEIDAFADVAAGATVPEPAWGGLMIATAAAIGWVQRRRRKQVA